MNLPWRVRPWKVKEGTGCSRAPLFFSFIWRIKPRTSRLLDLNSAFRLKPPASSGMALELPRPASSRVKWKRKSGCWGGASRGVFLSLGSTCFRRDRGAAFGKPDLEKQRLYWSASFSLKRKLGCCFFHVRVNFLPEPRWKLAVGFYTCRAAELEQPPVSFAHAGSHIAQKKLPGTFSLSQGRKKLETYPHANSWKS